MLVIVLNGVTIIADSLKNQTWDIVHETRSFHLKAQNVQFRVFCICVPHTSALEYRIS